MNSEEIEKRKLEIADAYGFIIPYDGTNNFYDKKAIKDFIAGFDACNTFLQSAQSAIEALNKDIGIMAENVDLAVKERNRYKEALEQIRMVDSYSALTDLTEIQLIAKTALQQ